MDQIIIKDLEVYGHHGVLKEENVLGQKFLVSMSLSLPLRKAGYSDDIADSIDYAKVSHLVKEEMEKTTFQLIEALAEHLCDAILKAFPQVGSITMELKKPWAPILLPLETVSVKLERSRHEAYLSVGANLGDKKKNIEDAIELLKKDEKITVERVSELIETKPYGVTDQPDFLNGAVFIRTLYDAFELLQKINEIENTLGRKREKHWGPRTIDLDILYYDDDIIESEKLTVPHVEIEKREFVLKPLCEIAPWKKHPVTGRTTIEMLEDIDS